MPDQKVTKKNTLKKKNKNLFILLGNTQHGQEVWLLPAEPARYGSFMCFLEIFLVFFWRINFGILPVTYHISVKYVEYKMSCFRY